MSRTVVCLLMDAGQAKGPAIDELVVEWMGKAGWDLVLIDKLDSLSPGSAQRLSLERHSGPLFLVSNRSTNRLVEELQSQSVSLVPTPHEFEAEDATMAVGSHSENVGSPTASIPIADRLIFKAYCLNPSRFSRVAEITGAIEKIQSEAAKLRPSLGGLPVLPMGPAGLRPPAQTPMPSETPSSTAGSSAAEVPRGDSQEGFARPKEGQLEEWMDELDDFDSV